MRRLWVGYLIVSVLLTIARAVVPEGSPITVLITLACPLVTIAAMLAGIRMHRPARRLPWLMLLAAVITGMAGVLVYVIYEMHGLDPYPSVADALWLGSTPVQLVAVLLLVNGMSWRRDRAGILDTLMVTGGLGLAVWLLFLRDLIGPGLPLETRLVTMAYPLGDLLLLAGAIRMCTSAARRSFAFCMLTASLVVQSVADSAWTWQSLHGTNENDLAAAFVLSAMLLGGSALHPSMTAFDAADTRRPAQVTPLRVAVIGSACLLSPVLMVVDGVTGHGRVDWLAESICCVAVFLLLIARMIGLIRTVQDQADQLESIAYTDALTGIPNRRAWDAELERRLAIARRHGAVLVLGLIDIDHFKRYNDLLGHPAGDQLLRDASTAWQVQLRPEDLIARYGGEEFGLIMHCRLRDAAIIMDRLRDATPGGQTFSAGLALCTGDESAEQLTARADAALYAAKRDGRDQFTVTGHPGRTDLTADFLAADAVSRA